MPLIIKHQNLKKQQQKTHKSNFAWAEYSNVHSHSFCMDITVNSLHMYKGVDIVCPPYLILWIHKETWPLQSRSQKAFARPRNLEFKKKWQQFFKLFIIRIKRFIFTFITLPSLIDWVQKTTFHFLRVGIKGPSRENKMWK